MVVQRRRDLVICVGVDAGCRRLCPRRAYGAAVALCSVCACCLVAGKVPLLFVFVGFLLRLA